MASEHQRPLAAYFLLCIAVAFLLTQGVLSGATTTFDRVVSRAGQPAALLVQSTTLTVLDQVGLVPEQDTVAPVAPITSNPATMPTRTRHAQQNAQHNAQTGHPRPPQAQGGAKAQHPGKSKHASVRAARATSSPKAHGQGHGRGNGHGKHT